MAQTSRGSILRRSSPGEGRPAVGPIQFFREVVSELKKVSWPSRQETTRLTALVIAVAVSIGIALGMLDLLLTRLLHFFLS